MSPDSVSPVAIIFLFAWTTFWKGFALWNAAKNQQRNWFISMLVLNLYTLGIVEIVYLFYFAKHKFSLSTVVRWYKKK